MALYFFFNMTGSIALHSLTAIRINSKGLLLALCFVHTSMDEMHHASFSLDIVLMSVPFDWVGYRYIYLPVKLPKNLFTIASIDVIAFQISTKNIFLSL